MLQVLWKPLILHYLISKNSTTSIENEIESVMMILMTKCLSYANIIPQAFSLSCTLFLTCCEILDWCLLPKSQEYSCKSFQHCVFLKTFYQRFTRAYWIVLTQSVVSQPMRENCYMSFSDFQDRFENATLVVQQEVNVNTTLAITVTLCIKHQMCQRSDILATKWSRHVLTLCNPDFHHKNETCIIAPVLNQIYQNETV